MNYQVNIQPRPVEKVIRELLKYQKLLLILTKK
ncbi:hypothetical protein NIES80_03930 [Dolichospermum planctonicum]|uniref:Uncharacterized protein n=1 Tax=Dolichospermum planctonicum TaxID=136072 RepID=A0A480AF39_9CYAN|nr:hypothetical protein NIES80_03930 [Dolichospermum planctonicum]